MCYNAKMSNESIDPNVQSLSELPNWGTDYPENHRFSTLDQISKWNEENEQRPFDEALSTVDVIRRWANPDISGSLGLYLYGTPGTGKTHFAIGLGRELVQHEVDVAYLYLPKLGDNEYHSFDNVSGFMTNPTNPMSNYETQYIFSRNRVISDASQTVAKYARRGKSALILDDYRPQYQQIAYAAIEAAAERGGLVIITSNHTNPFGLLEKRSPILTDDELAKRAMLSQIDPEGLATADTNRQIESDARQASLASRIAAMVKLVEFTGEDKRIEKSLWNF